jgi:hypothetical protein
MKDNHHVLQDDILYDFVTAERSLEFVLNQLNNDSSKKITDNCCESLTFEELIGCLRQSQWQLKEYERMMDQDGIFISNMIDYVPTDVYERICKGVESK